MIRRHSRRGFAFLSVLMALAIVAVLTTNYMSADVPGGKPWAIVQQDRARAAVTAINTRTMQTQYFMATEGRRPPIDQLRRLMDGYSQSAGGGGRFFLDQNENVQNTTLLQTKTFHEQSNLPSFR
ncbi:hypothetical protein GC173_17390 [bacterium]|nr:hypothetical protein [bacterium]